MGKHSRQKKLDDIQQQLNVLLCFSTQENVSFMQTIREFPEEGLDVFLSFLAEAQQEQDKFFAETLRRNPEFSKAFSRFLTQTCMQIKLQYETKERSSAENILREI